MGCWYIASRYEALRAWLHDPYGWEFTTKLPKGLPKKLGTFGDFFGGVLNPILTFLTFFGLILTIVIQRIELRLTREEYRKTSKAMATQAIETTFFNLIDLHHKIVDGLVFGTDMIIVESTREQMLAGIPPAASATFTGRAVFGAILSCIAKNKYHPSSVGAKYTKFQKEKNFVLGHYFRNLYQALKAIDPSSDCVLTTAQANKYASILRAQLSTTELAVLFLNCLDGVVDGGEFKNLLIRPPTQRSPETVWIERVFLTWR